MPKPPPMGVEEGNRVGRKDFRRILVRANNWIGDVVMISPAMRSLRERFPEAEITILAKPRVLEALEGSSLFDRLLPYDKRRQHAGVRGFLKMVAELRRCRFDCAVLFQNAFEAALLTYLARIPTRIGYATDGRSPLLTKAIPLRPDSWHRRHRGEEFLDLIEFLGCERNGGPTDFPLPASGPASARPSLRPGRAVRVALHPGASKAARAWHQDRYAEVGSRLQETLGAEILLLGGPGEKSLIDSIGRRLPTPPLTLPEPAGVKSLAIHLNSCDLLIGNDSGPMHIAGALGIDVIGIFGPGSPRRTGPFRPRSQFVPVTAGFPCAPCRQRFFLECDPLPSGKPPCLEEISVEDVMREAFRLLGNRRQPPPQGS